MHIQRPNHHQSCVICGDKQQAHDLGLRFSCIEDGSVSAEFTPTVNVQGYQGVMHGGMICSLLDAAMTNCLFSLGVNAMTADLQVRFMHPIPLNKTIMIHGRLLQKRRGIYLMSSHIESENQKLATANAKFLIPKIM